MAYADSLLADGEVIVRRARQHWLAVVVDGRRGWVLILIGLLALVTGLALRGDSGTAGTIGQALSVIALVALAVGLLLAGYQVVRWRAQDYLVTNRRVLQVEGVLNKRAADSSLEKINDAILDPNLLGRMLGYGDLDILTASKSAIDRFRMLAHAADFKREMLNQKHDLEIDLARPPSPPLRADGAPQPLPDAGGPRPTPTGAPSASPDAGIFPGRVPVAAANPRSAGDGQAAAAAPSTPVPPRNDAEQVTATLGRLAELRDRGAITAADYEAKKAELLARL